MFVMLLLLSLVLWTSVVTIPSKSRVAMCDHSVYTCHAVGELMVIPDYCSFSSTLHKTNMEAVEPTDPMSGRCMLPSESVL